MEETEVICPVCNNSIPISYDTLNKDKYFQCCFCGSIIKNSLKGGLI
jgi:hypothetical protein